MQKSIAPLDEMPSIVNLADFQCACCENDRHAILLGTAPSTIARRLLPDACIWKDQGRQSALAAPESEVFDRAGHARRALRAGYRRAQHSVQQA